jgi:hypothetical protein
MRLDVFELIVWALAIIVTGMLVAHWIGMY